MRERIAAMRRLFGRELDQRGVQLSATGNDFIAAQNGMFSFSGLDREQVARLRDEHSIYIVGSGRLNVAGMTESNMPRLCDAIAAVCDIRIAGADMAFGFPIARTLGNCLSVASLQRLNGVLGAGLTRDLLLTARLLDAEEAQRVGLVSEILGDADAVLARAKELAVTMAGFAPITLKVTKELCRRIDAGMPEIDDRDMIAHCYGSDDFREGLDAFLNKRKPTWKGQ